MLHFVSLLAVRASEDNGRTSLRGRGPLLLDLCKPGGKPR